MDSLTHSQASGQSHAQSGQWTVSHTVGPVDSLKNSQANGQSHAQSGRWTVSHTDHYLSNYWDQLT